MAYGLSVYKLHASRGYHAGRKGLSVTFNGIAFTNWSFWTFRKEVNTMIQMFKKFRLAAVTTTVPSEFSYNKPEVSILQYFSGILLWVMKLNDITKQLYWPLRRTVTFMGHLNKQYRHSPVAKMKAQAEFSVAWLENALTFVFSQSANSTDQMDCP